MNNIAEMIPIGDVSNIPKKCVPKLLLIIYKLEYKLAFY